MPAFHERAANRASLGKVPLNIKKLDVDEKFDHWIDFYYREIPFNVDYQVRSATTELTNWDDLLERLDAYDKNIKIR